MEKTRETENQSIHTDKVQKRVARKKAVQRATKRTHTVVNSASAKSAHADLHNTNAKLLERSKVLLSIAACAIGVSIGININVLERVSTVFNKTIIFLAVQLIACVALVCAYTFSKRSAQVQRTYSSSIAHTHAQHSVPSQHTKQSTHKRQHTKRVREAEDAEAKEWRNLYRTVGK